ncbi:MAG TPA: hypothetical protein VKV26_23800 [Dehalococcoidia bacterium]|nr:hypothetical protein [Dehalococcoidia bacterium]
MEPVQRQDLFARFTRELREGERAVIAAARAWAAEQAAPLYLVGGSVRDLLLGRGHLDLDLALEGDLAALTRELSPRFRSEVTFHEQFGTASLEGIGWALDLVRTRSERYGAPADLPLVEPAGIAEDLARRDFTAHAMALRLDGESAGMLLDPFAGEADLQRRLFRVLHGESFRDDPTRLLRLARYAARLGFAVEPETLRLARRDAVFLDSLTPARITHELVRGFAEPLPETMLSVLGELRALRRVLPALSQTEAVSEWFSGLRADGGAAPAFADYLCTLGADWSRTDLQWLVRRLELRQDVLAALHDLPGATRTLRELVHAGADAADVVEALARIELPAIRGAGARAGGAKAKLVRRYIGQWRDLRPRLRGDDLLALGVPAGPAVGAVLRALTAARLRGRLPDRSAEQAFVGRWLEAARTGQTFE